MEQHCWWIFVFFGALPFAQSSTYNTNAKSARSGLLVSYVSTIRPAQTVEVSVGFSLLAITKMVSDENMMSAVGWFTVTWSDDFLIWDSGQGSFQGVTSLHFKEGEIWRPELRIENAVESVDILANEYHRFRVLDNGTVTWVPASQMDVHCVQDLTYYPFDKQRCHVTLASWSHDVSEVMLKASMASIDLSHFVENAEWNLDEETTVTLSNGTSTAGADAIETSRITFYVTMSRMSNLAGLTFLLPLLLLSLLSTLVFLLPVAGGEKVTYSAVVMVSIFVFYLSTLENFPVSKAVPIRVTYMTVIIVLSCLSVLFSCVVVWLYNQKPDKPMSRKVSVFLEFLNIVCCGVKQPDSVPDTRPTIEIHSETGTSAEHNKQLSPIQNGGGHLTVTPSAPSLHTMERLPPVNEHMKKNKVRPKSGESVYSVTLRKARQASGSNVNNWQNLAERLDAFLIVLFAILSVLVHLIFLVTLAAGGKYSDP